MSLDELVETVSMQLAAAGVQPRSATLRATLAHGQHNAEAATAFGADALRRVKAIAAGAEPPLAILSTLGEGGMGIVQLGTQRSLGREVAIKTLRAATQNAEGVARLVREAVLTGALEHPNVVPVYDLAVGAEGVPVLVMKRVEGSTWTVRMRDAGSAVDLAGAGDLLEWNLATLMSVCQAVHYAHSRGVVHRDLKPDNVMIGGFGEVYVVDWGVAVRVAGGAEAPQSSRGSKILGTPAYMAPEMLLCEPITPATDVYLLGTILFEILAGRAPHDVEGGLTDVVRSVLGPPPALDASAPEELVDLVRACMQREPNARPASADEVRRAVAEFLRHRGSSALAARADRRLRELEALLAEKAPHGDRVQRLYGEVTFGFRAAIEAWEENDAARAGLARATRALVRHELDHGAARAARARLADLLVPDPALRAEVDEANARADAVARQDAALRREMDPRTGRTARRLSTLLLGGLWTLQPLAQQIGLFGAEAETPFAGILMAVAGGVVWVVAFLIFRRTIWSSRMNRQLAGAALLVVVAQIIAYAGAWRLGIAADTTQVLLLFVWFCVVAILGVAIERRLLIPACGFLAAFAVSAVDMRFRLFGEAGANLILTATALVSWRGPSAGEAPADERGRDA